MPGTGPSGPGRVALPAAVAGVLARVGTLLMLGWPATGVVGPSDVTGGAAPRDEGSLPAAVSGVTGVPAQATCPYQMCCLAACDCCMLEVPDCHAQGQEKTAKQKVVLEEAAVSTICLQVDA